MATSTATAPSRPAGGVPEGQRQAVCNGVGGPPPERHSHRATVVPVAVRRVSTSLRRSPSPDAAVPSDSGSSDAPVYFEIVAEVPPAAEQGKPGCYIRRGGAEATVNVDAAGARRRGGEGAESEGSRQAGASRPWRGTVEGHSKTARAREDRRGRKEVKWRRCCFRFRGLQNPG
uniref:Uncharacterized protein n=1 Tax=Oryza sativa subsp. japonica TaxID=39947 RepID=Q6Z0E9_ORYSJ|nr:hypothetical protein [Oryza sativa Japonica Group]BAD03649.1 hypothetical protein [Oryza sativa Japonica Group]